jgi:hypothetical protein
MSGRDGPGGQPFGAWLRTMVAWLRRRLDRDDGARD